MMGLLDAFKNQWQQGAPYRDAAIGLLSGDSQPIRGLLGKKEYVEPMTQEQAMTLAMDWGPMALGKIVYHGSPHKFNKFDMSKIGTGEGAQAYGHGLYFAESPDVAKSYQKLGEVVSIGGKPVSGGRTAAFDAPDGMSKTAMDVLGLHQWNVKTALDSLGKDYAESSTIGDKSYYMYLIRQIKQIPQNKIAAEGGNLYKVDIPDESIAKMLDWDKPLSQQSPEVRKALQVLRDSAKKTLPNVAEGDPTARGIYTAYQSHRGGNQAAVSEKLRELGIPGIRYLDNGSRSVGNGTSNYVVFDDSLPKILERK
jgi:hypothetical protein